VPFSLCAERGPADRPGRGVALPLGELRAPAALGLLRSRPPAGRHIFVSCAPLYRPAGLHRRACCPSRLDQLRESTRPVSMTATLDHMWQKVSGPGSRAETDGVEKNSTRFFFFPHRREEMELLPSPRPPRFYPSPTPLNRPQPPPMEPPTCCYACRVG